MRKNTNQYIELIKIRISKKNERVFYAQDLVQKRTRKRVERNWSFNIKRDRKTVG